MINRYRRPLILTATITNLWHTISPGQNKQTAKSAPVYFSETRTLQTTLFSEVSERHELAYRLHYTRAAQNVAPDAAHENRPAFVLVHGIGMSHRYFARLQARLLVHGDVVALDLPGFGGTTTPVRQLTTADYASIIAHALEAAQLTSCVVVGHSMGAQFVTELAMQCPDLVSAVLLIGPVTDTVHPSAARNAVMLGLNTLLERPVTNVLVSTAYLLIHGIGMSHRYFLRLGHQLSRVGSVLLIDLPGYGWTRRPTRGATNLANAELLAALLDQMGVFSCTVVRRSMGVQTATELATQRPDLVSHLVLIGAAVDERRRTVPQQALTLGLNFLLEKPVLNTVQFMDVLRCDPRWYPAELAIAMNYRLEERLPQATQPVLILRGSRNLVAGTRWLRSLAESAQHGVLTVISGAPHAVHHSSPATVAAHIISFIASARTTDRP